MNKQRLLGTLEELAAHYNDTPELGVTRITWTPAYKKALSFLETECSKMNLKNWVDDAGNFHALYEGKSQEPRIIIGSHLDTVRNGGKYDGTYGTVSALEVLRSFKEENFVPYRSVEFIAFAEEEGSNFGTTCLGSKLICGAFKAEDLKKLSNNETNAWDLLVSFGLNPDNIQKQQLSPKDISAFLEVHIEQGSVLEEKNCPIGIVQAISGMLMFKIVFKGKSTHAASPMAERRDPLVCFVNAHKALQEAYGQGKFSKGLSFTCGHVLCHPDLGNVVPDECAFTLDLRHVDVSLLHESWEQAKAIILKQAETENIEAEITLLSDSGGVKMDEKIRKAYCRAAQKLGYSHMFLNSGPAHDAAPMAKIAPAGLLFVPSRGGISHNPYEHTDGEDLAAGAAVYEEAVRLMAEHR